jgi:hypothetical protein
MDFNKNQADRLVLDRLQANTSKRISSILKAKKAQENSTTQTIIFLGQDPSTGKAIIKFADGGIGYADYISNASVGIGDSIVGEFPRMALYGKADALVRS